VIDVAKDALALMSDALAGLGDAHAIYGFSGNGRHDVEFHVAKDFTDAVSPASWAAIAAIEPRGSTRMGPAIRHAAAKLARQPSPLRLLILVSDGYPQDTDYGPDRNSEEYGIQDTAQALREAERAGIATFCVTIDPGGHDYLRRMCSPERYRVIDDVAALPAALGEIYAGLTSRGG
jgi:nitric oxide reductase activation protein